jgi:hypothetical protein
MRYLLFPILLLLTACHKKESGAECTKGKTLEMYKMSEMAALMEQMYADHQRVRAHILKGEPIGEFPEYYNRIRSAKMTDETDNDAFFRENARRYLSAEKMLFENPGDKTRFNQSVDACMRCHAQKCGGPVPRIRKLYIR